MDNSMVTQREGLLVAYKKEIMKNALLLNKFQCMSVELTGLLKENALEKPTQHFFNNLVYYFLSIIDAKVSASLTWPIFDSSCERAFRNVLASFICDYSKKGLLSPIMQSYLLKPGCYKVTLLIYQLSQLAIERILVTKMEKDSEKQLYAVMTERYKSKDKEGFTECSELKTRVASSKFYYYILNRRSKEQIAAQFRRKIDEMLTKHASIEANIVNVGDLVDGFIQKHQVDEETKIKLCKIKNANEHSEIFDAWLEEIDIRIDNMEQTWNKRMTPLFQSCQKMYQLSKALVARHIENYDRSSYTIEYNHITDVICTKHLQTQVNSHQKYVLKNIVKDGCLDFPNLIRAYVIAMSVILKNKVMGDEIYKFNEYLEGGRGKYSEVVSAMRDLIKGIAEAEAKLQPKRKYNQSLYIKDMPGYEALPECLSNLRSCRDPNQVLFNSFTPLRPSMYQLNLRRNTGTAISARPLLMSKTPLYTGPRENTSHNISCRVIKHNSTQYNNQLREDFNNLSAVSHVTRGNETIAECSSGHRYTKHKILQMLSNKKSSSSKNHKFKKIEKRNNDVKKRGLFNDSVASNETCNDDISKVLFRNYSSPNLYENREKCYLMGRGRQLSIMKEDIPILEMSGIAAIDGGIHNTENYNIIAKSVPEISTLDVPVVKNDLVNEISNSIISPIKEKPRKCMEISEKSTPSNAAGNFREVNEVRYETPKANAKVVKNSNSLEKIINRYKKVRASVLPNMEDLLEYKTMDEEIHMRSGIKGSNVEQKRVLLPDLVSPSSCNMKSGGNIENVDENKLDNNKVDCRNKRQSLGTLLGVDQSILDQYDLID